MMNYIPLHRRWSLLIKTIPFVILIFILKYMVFFFELELLQFSSFFTAIISANIFLISFLISGVLSDYKESEKIPSDIASSIISLADEGMIILEEEQSPNAKKYLQHIQTINKAYIDWFYQKNTTLDVIHTLRELNHYFYIFQKTVPAPFISRLKQEQHILRKLINRVDTIRETSFLGTGYVIVETISFILIITMLFVNFGSVYEGLFFSTFVSLILIYMILFIKDLDNPFGYAQDEILTEEVSLKPLHDNIELIKTYIKS